MYQYQILGLKQYKNTHRVYVPVSHTRFEPVQKYMQGTSTSYYFKPYLCFYAMFGQVKIHTEYQYLTFFKPDICFYQKYV